MTQMNMTDSNTNTRYDLLNVYTHKLCEPQSAMDLLMHVTPLSDIPCDVQKLQGDITNE